MAYPASLDVLESDFLNTTKDATPGTEYRAEAGVHAGHHNALANAIMAAQATLGVDPQAAYATVADRLNALVPLSAVGAASGVASLDRSGLLPAAELPSGVIVAGSAYSGTILGGSGTNASIVLPTPATGQLLQLQVGDIASRPDTSLNPAGKVVRAMSILSRVVTGDGSEQCAAFTGVALGDAANQIQTVGLLGEAQNLGTTKGSTDSPDACGIYGIGRIDSSGIGVGIGGFFNGMTNTANGLASGIQVQVYNNSGRNDSVNPTGFPSTSAVWAIAQGPNRSAVGYALGNPFGQQFDVGIHANSRTGATRTDAGCVTTSGQTVVTDPSCVASDRGRLVTGTNIPPNAVITSVTPGTSFTFATPTGASATGSGTVSLTLAQVGPTLTADFRTDSNAFTGILVNGIHTTAAIAVAAGAGATILGGTTKVLTTTILEVQGPGTSTDPLAMFGDATGSFYTVQIRNGSGNGRWFVAAGADNGIRGTIAGDTGMIATTSSKFFHIGGSSSVIRVGNDNTLCLFARSSATVGHGQYAAAAVTSGFTANAGTAMNSASTSTGGSGTSAYTFGDVIAALKSWNMLAA